MWASRPIAATIRLVRASAAVAPAASTTRSEAISRRHWRGLEKGAAPRASQAAQHVVHDHHRPTGLEAKVHPDEAALLQRRGDPLLAFGLAVKDEKATPTGAGDLAS